MSIHPVDSVTPSAPATFTSSGPASGEYIAQFAIHNSQDVAAIVARARAATHKWQNQGFSGRARQLKRWRQLMLTRFDELTDLVSRETGKPQADATIEVVIAIDHLHWAAGNAKRVLKRHHVAPGMLMFNHSATVEYRPLGVVAVIGPWNYPVFTPMGSIAYALAAGNAVVFKPSEFTPAVGYWLVDAFNEALGDPAGKHSPLHLVTGDGTTGNALCRSLVNKVAFTGSAATGRRVMTACADSLIPVLMECGGKDALLVDTDADLKAAADAAVWGSVSNAGQTCIGVERIYVAESVAGKFIDMVTERASKLRVGAQPDADIGPITTPAQVDIVTRHIEDGISRGGQARVGGVESVRAPFVEPVVLIDVPENSIAVSEETFGPVILINRVQDMDSAVKLANAAHYGLGATVFSKRRGKAIARQLNVGMVGVNSILPYVAIPTLPFGGCGQSGFGRIHGADGLREFAQPQSVAAQLFPPLLKPTSFARSRHTMGLFARLAKLLYRW
jgi:acyl-CoA reductase-like NAD-dependent aldehyde dehydrogenase